jgi:hypothetical protein
MKHTPSPWNLGTETLIVRSSNRESHIADCGISYSLSDSEMKSNARLIAAAPELLEALEAMLAEMQVWESELGEHPAATKARAVLAKAKGETP